MIFAYLYSGTWLGFCIGALLVGAGAQLVDATLFDRVLALLSATGTPAAAARWDEAQQLLAQGVRGPALGLGLIGLAIWLGTAGWLAVAWDAFGNAFGIGRVRAAMAGGLWLAILVALGALLRRLA